MAIEIVSFPIKNGDFPIATLNYQRVFFKWGVSTKLVAVDGISGIGKCLDDVQLKQDSLSILAEILSPPEISIQLLPGRAFWSQEHNVPPGP